MAKKAANATKQKEEIEQPNRRPFNTNLDEGLVLQAKIRCLRDGIGMNDVIEQLLDQWLKNAVEIEIETSNK